MRSSRSGRSKSGPDPLDPGRNGFAHRGLHRWPQLPENTLVAFAAALELGAGIECDLRLTADDRLVVTHDADGLRLSGRADRVIDHTQSEVAAWPVAEQRVATVEQLLRLVDGKVPLLLEAKVSGPELWRMGPAILRALDGYDGPVGVMSFDPRLSRWLKTNAPGMQRGLAISDHPSAFRRRWALWLAEPTFAAVDVAALGKSWVAALRQRMPVYSWTSKTSDEARLVRDFADAAIWESDGRP